MIAKGAVREYLEQPLDSFTWMKRLPKETILREFRQFKVRPQFKTDPWTHQLVCFYIAMCMPEFLFLLDMGLGKTKLLLDIMTQRQREKKLNKVLVTVPRVINLDSWNSAILEHSDFEPTLASGSIEEKWEKLSNPYGDITVIDYPGLMLALTSKVKGKMTKDPKKLRQVQKLYNFVTIDECHKAKNRDTVRFGLLKSITKFADYTYALTGTLFGRQPEDIWAQFYLVDKGDTFGDTVGMFRAAFFNEVANQFSGHANYEFDKANTRTLHRRLQHRSIRYDEHEVPEAEIPYSGPPQQIRCKFGSQEQREHYLRAVEGLINAGGNLREIDSAFIRMRQLAAGYLQWSDGEKHTVFFNPNEKLDHIERILDESDGKIVISHEFIPSGKMITERIAKLGYKFEWLYGGTKDPSGSVRRFMQDPTIKAFVMNSECGGTGTDGLQKVSNHLVFFECPVSPITRVQTIKRIRRPGQQRRTYITDLVLEKSIDLRILDFIAEGRGLYESIVGGKLTRNELT